MKSFPPKGDSQAGFWSVNRSLTNKIRMYMCIKIIRWALATWWGDIMMLYNGKNARSAIKKYTEWFVHSDFWTSHSTSLSFRLFCESILKKKRIPDTPKEIILSQDWHVYPHSSIQEFGWCLFEIHVLCSPKSSLFFLFMQHFKVDSHSTPHAHWGMKFKILIHIRAPSIGATLGFVLRVLPGEFLTQKKRLLHAAIPWTQADRDKGREAVME